MSFEIPVSFVEQFKDNIYMLAQQRGSKLMNAVRVESITGKSKYFERLGPTEAVQRTSRHSDTPLVSSPHSRRKVNIADWEWADLIDKQDEIRLLIDPQSAYTKNGASALGRTMDDVIFEAIRGNALAGETGSTTIALPADRRVTESGTDGLTKAKLIEGRVRLLNSDVDPDSDTFHIACHPNQLVDLLNDTTLTSADYNTVRALVSGDFGAANNFMGYQWHMTTRTPLKEGTSDKRDVCVWAESGIGMAVGKGIEAKISERADKSYATQVYLCMTIGATRIEEDKVVILESHEA